MGAGSCSGKRAWICMQLIGTMLSKGGISDSASQESLVLLCTTLCTLLSHKACMFCGRFCNNIVVPRKVLTCWCAGMA